MAELRDRPFPAHWTVRQGLEVYLAENGFTKDEYSAPTTKASFLGIPFRLPNTPRHAAAIMRHDLHHVATGFGTDLRGEAEVSAWELRGGLSGIGAYVGAIVLSIIGLGAFIAPVRCLRAYRHGRTNLFREEGYEALLDLTVGELRVKLGLPPEGIAGHRELHSQAPRTAPVPA